MATLNLCQFIGNIGKKETRYLPDGKAVCNLSLAVNENYKDKSGNKVEKTEWIRAVTFGKLAEIVEQYCAVGQSIYISGKITTRKWEKDGQTHYATEIIADTMQMLGAKTGEPRAANVAQPAQGSGAGNSVADFEDDIPFLFNESHFDATMKIPSSLARANRAKEGLLQVRRIKTNY